MPKIQCAKIQPDLTYAENGVIRWNTTELDTLDFKVTCTASFINRINDNKVEVKEEFRFLENCLVLKFSCYM